jgi:hypothetical protein
MKQIKLAGEPVQLETNKLYKLAEMVQGTNDTDYYCFSFIQLGDEAHCLYGTCTGYNPDSCFWHFERYPDKTQVYLSATSANMSATRNGIFEYESEEEMIMDKMK